MSAILIKIDIILGNDKIIPEFVYRNNQIYIPEKYKTKNKKKTPQKSR